MTDPKNHTVSLSFSPWELETLRVALLSAHYNADDEERALHRQLATTARLSEEWGRIEDGRAKAALRAMAYHLLAERVMAAQKGAASPKHESQR